jgi:integrase/recombinase XerD
MRNYNPQSTSRCDTRTGRLRRPAQSRTYRLGRRDHALLLFLYNIGARADETAQALIGDLDLAVCGRGHSYVSIRGKGNKIRRWPLWPLTVEELRALIDGRAPTERLFLNRCGQPTTRFGIYDLIERYINRVVHKFPSLTKKRVSPHCIRRTTATHLLRSGVDSNTIRAWLGHVSLATTNIYVETDLEMKPKALAHCEVKEAKRAKK